MNPEENRDAVRGITPHPTSAQAQRERVYLIALPSQQALDAAVIHMTPRGYALESRTGMSVTFVRHEGPDFILGCVLTLLLILPGILYLILAGHDTRTTLTALDTEGGCRLLIGGDDWTAQQEIHNWSETLPQLS